jgi:hypothetical protein
MSRRGVAGIWGAEEALPPLRAYAQPHASAVQPNKRFEQARSRVAQDRSACARCSNADRSAEPLA